MKSTLVKLFVVIGVLALAVIVVGSVNTTLADVSAQGKPPTVVLPTRVGTKPPTLTATPTKPGVQPQVASTPVAPLKATATKTATRVGVRGKQTLTTKTLSTAFTLVNMGTNQATVTASYIKAMPDGNTWDADNTNENFTIDGNGGSKIIRLYNDATMTSGRGSAVINSTEQLGAVVQILARVPPNTLPSQSAYSGIIQPASTWYAPMLFHQLTNAEGKIVNSQLAIQNTGSSATSVTVSFYGTAGNYTSPAINIGAGATYYYDMDGENNLPTPWNGSGVITASGDGQIAVVVSIYTGADTIQTYNAFPSTASGTIWLIPMFSSRLANGQSTSVNVQNLSGGQIPAGGITLNCQPDPGCAGCSAFSKSTPSALDNNRSYSFNPVTDLTMPSDWYGSCVVNSGSYNTITFVQIRRLGTSLGAAYEGIKGGSTNTKVIFPLVSKRLANGQAMVAKVQNVDLSNAANVNLTFTPAAEYVAGGGNATPITWSGTIPAGQSLHINMRQNPLLINGVAPTPTMPDGWYGTLTAVSTNGRPLHGMVQITNYLSTAGDTNQAHLGFTSP